MWKKCDNDRLIVLNGRKQPSIVPERYSFWSWRLNLFPRDNRSNSKSKNLFVSILRPTIICVRIEKRTKKERQLPKLYDLKAIYNAYRGWSVSYFVHHVVFAVEIFIITFNKWKECEHQNGVCLTSIIDNREEKEIVKKIVI